MTATAGRPELMLKKLASLAAQTLPRDAFEWCIAIDGADPGLQRRLEAAKPEGLAMHIVTTPGLGAGPARDAAAAVARFGTLLFSDDDCLLPNDLLERHATAQRAPAVYVGAIAFDDGQAPWTWAPRRPDWGNVNGANCSCPTSSFREVGGFGTSLQGYGGEDLYLGWRLRQRGLEVLALAGEPARHVGAAPQRTRNMARVRQAGANAVRIASLAPRTAWRLGVHPVQVIVKDVILSLVRPFGGPAVQRECAYLEGARDARGAVR